MSTPSYDLPALLATDMNTPLDPAVVTSILHTAPFVNLPGALNIRDIALLPSSPIPSGLLYRSGAIHAVSPPALRDLGVEMILNLQSTREIAQNPDPVVEGVENMWFEPSSASTPLDLARFMEKGGIKGYVDMYMEILEIHAASFRAGLEWVRDKRGAMLFHCTAGKDRTAVLAAILLSLAGAGRETIAYDYTLTRVGVESGREMLLQALKMWNREWSADTPGMQEFVQVKGEFILGFLDKVDEKYGSVEGYARDVLGFRDDEVWRIRSVLRGEVKKCQVGE